MSPADPLRSVRRRTEPSGTGGAKPEGGGLPAQDQRRSCPLSKLDVITGEPQLYCGDLPAPFMPRTLALLASIYRHCSARVRRAVDTVSHASAAASQDEGAREPTPAVRPRRREGNAP